jgi:hypothetical protein
MRAIRHSRSRVDRRACVACAPCADAIVVFQGESERIYPDMAGRAGGVGAVGFHLLAKSQRLPVGGFGLQAGNLRRRRRAENIFEDPLAAPSDGCAVIVGGDRQNTALPKQTATLRILQLYAPELWANNTRNAVVAREPLV